MPPSEHEVLVFLVAFLVLLTTARLLGAVAQRIGQPSVVGELAAGLLLGPSVLGRLAPSVEEWLFPADPVQTAMVFTVSWLGVMFLLLVTGFETDLGLIRRLGRAAAVVSTGSLLVPVAFGLAVGALMPAFFLGTDDRLSFALFMGAALSISSLPVIAKILRDMGFLRRNFGQLTLAAGMANDVVGWIALGVIAGVVSAGTISVTGVATTLAGVALFFAAAFTVGQRLIDAGFRWLRRVEADRSTRTTVLVACTLAGAALTQWLGVEAVLGAFVVGILVGRSPFRDPSVLQPIETATSAYLAPVFFATAGLRVDLGLLGDPEVALWAVVVLAVASASKFLGALGGAALVHLPRREGAALGVALNARGALEIVIASVGLSLGVLNAASYTVVVLMAMATSMMAPPLLRSALRGWPGTAEEQERLRQEDSLHRNLVVRAGRVLLPSRGGPQSLLAGQIVDLAWPAQVPVTVLTAGGAAPGDALVPLTNVLGEHELRTVRTEGEAADAIAAEAKLGYDVVVLGLSELADGELLPPVVHEVVARARVPVVLVRRPRHLDTLTPWAFGRALVPVAGTRTARAAQEIAFGISARLGTETVIAHVTGPSSDGADGGAGRALAERSAGSRVGLGILLEASEQAATTGARILTVERSGAPAAEILRLTEEVAADLVVVGATRRPLGDGVYLGHTVTEILARCDATVVVAVLPEQSEQSET